MSEHQGEAVAVRRRPSGMAIGIAFITLLFVAVTVFSIVQGLNPAATPRGLLPAEMRKKTSLSMHTLDDKPWSLADRAGKVVVVNYFATWCPPCIHELPDLRKIHADYAPRGVEMAAVSLDNDADRNRPRAEVLKEFDAYERLPFPILLPPAESPLMRQATTIPQTFLVDKQGRIALHVTGPVDPGKLRPMIDQLLAEP